MKACPKCNRKLKPKEYGTELGKMKCSCGYKGLPITIEDPKKVISVVDPETKEVMKFRSHKELLKEVENQKNDERKQDILIRGLILHRLTPIVNQIKDRMKVSPVSEDEIKEQVFNKHKSKNTWRVVLDILKEDPKITSRRTGFLGIFGKKIFEYKK